MKFVCTALLSSALFILTSCDQVNEMKNSTKEIIQQTIENAEQEIEKTKDKINKVKDVFKDPQKDNVTQPTSETLEDSLPKSNEEIKSN